MKFRNLGTTLLVTTFLFCSTLDVEATEVGDHDAGFQAGIVTGDTIVGRDLEDSGSIVLDTEDTLLLGGYYRYTFHQRFGGEVSLFWFDSDTKGREITGASTVDLDADAQFLSAFISGLYYFNPSDRAVVHARGGVGLVSWDLDFVNVAETDGSEVAMIFGIGATIAINDRFAVSGDLNDQLWELKGDDDVVGRDTEWMNNVSATIGINISLGD